MRYLITLLTFITYIYAKPIVAVSIPPQKYIVDSISKGLVESMVIVEPGNSPHTYEPKPSQMVKLSKAKAYLAIGVEFERAWLPKFTQQNSKLKVFYVDKNITKISINHNLEIEDDPHIWLNSNNLKEIAKSTTKALISIDPQNREIYLNNLKEFIVKIDKNSKEIESILKDVEPRVFLIFHPSWGYFAKEYNLKQIAVEISGKEPTPKELIAVLNLAKKYRVKTIFVQPEFSKKSVNLIAKELNIHVKEVTPLKYNILDNMLNFAKMLKGR